MNEDQMKSRIAELEAQLIKEAARTAEQKLRADQMTQQHSMQAKMHSQALTQLAAVQQGVEQEGRTDDEIVERTETAARFLLEWKYGLTPEADGAQLRHSKNAKAQWAWEAACKAQEIITDSDAVNAAQEVDNEPTTHPIQPGLDAPTLDDAWKARLLDDQELNRDEIGCGFHPALPNIDEGVRIDDLLKVFGIEWSYGTAESEMSHDAYEEMVFGDHGGDYRKWTPEKPDGEGWCLVAVFATDDGPACWWVRASQEKQEGV